MVMIMILSWSVVARSRHPAPAVPVIEMRLLEMKITFNAFSFLQKKLSDNGLSFYNVEMEIPDNTTVHDLIEQLKLSKSDVEGVFINGTIVPFDQILKSNDRVGLLPPGTPGPYRVMLGIVKKQEIL